MQTKNDGTHVILPVAHTLRRRTTPDAATVRALHDRSHPTPSLSAEDCTARQTSHRLWQGSCRHQNKGVDQPRRETTMAQKIRFIPPFHRLGRQDKAGCPAPGAVRLKPVCTLFLERLTRVP